MTTIRLTLPLAEDEARALHVGDMVTLSGTLVTARDAAHKYMVETFIRPERIPPAEAGLHERLQQLLQGGVIYHCGPVVRRDTDAELGWTFVAAGPTTSIREEPYEPDVIAHFGLRGVIGKGGMGPTTLEALQAHGAVYFNAIGGAASLIAQAVKDVIEVHKRETFGTPEALWVIRVEHFPVIVTMDAHGQSLHQLVADASSRRLAQLLD